MLECFYGFQVKFKGAEAERIRQLVWCQSLQAANLLELWLKMQHILHDSIEYRKQSVEPQKTAST